MSLTHAKVLAQADDPTQAARARPSDWDAPHVGVLDIANGGTGSITAALARTALGLGSVATQPSPLDLLHGGTGATDAPSARTALGLGNIALEFSPLAVTKGGTGITAMGTANQVLGVNAGATALEYKTLAGTASRLTVTHTAGNVGFDISATYVGQASITTLGTVTTGAWSATAIAAGKGGTGVDTSGSTGVPQIAAGVWSVTSTLAASLGGTALNTSTLSGVVSINAGTWNINNVLTPGQVLYAAAGNTVASSANLFWDAVNSRLGIGTATPTARIHLVGTAIGTSSSIGIQNTGAGGKNWLIGEPSTAGTFGILEAGMSRDAFRITSAGLVGIGQGLGALPPLSALDVAGGVAIGTYAGSTAAPSNGLIVSGRVGIGIPPVVTAYLQVKTGTDLDLSVRQGADFGAGFSGVAIDSITDAATVRNMMIIAGNPVVFTGGNVGVGTPTPSVAFDLNGAARMRVLGAFAAGDKYVIADVNGNLHVSALGPAS